MDLVGRDDIEDMISEHMCNNYSFVESGDVEVMISDELERFKSDIINEVIKAITNKLTGKELHHANNDRDTSIQVSGVNGHSQTESNGTLNT
jgi:hypothetical protein